MAALQYTPVCGCGNPLKVFVSSGRAAAACSPACYPSRIAPPIRIQKPQNPDHPCVDCGNPIWRESVRCRTCAGVKHRTQQGNAFVCEQCGKPAHRKLSQTNRKLGSVNRWCSMQCRVAWNAEHNQESRAERKERALAASKRREDRLANRKPQYSSIWFRSCDKCCEPYVARRSNQRHCSSECAKPERNEVEHRNCESCGSEFITSRLDKLYCSDKCRPDRGLRKFKQRARHYGVFYEPVNEFQVFNRDGWKCQICGKSTPQQQRGKHKPNSPELDHRVPMSKGGPHTYANTQCSCRECNGAKGNKLNIGQLPLFAV